MRPVNRRRRAILRGRRRFGWDTGTHLLMCECVDCSALYGAIHALLCRCPECVAIGAPLIGPMTGYSLFLLNRYGGVT